MSDDFIPQMMPWFDVEERQALDCYMQEGGFLTEFKQTQKFEEMIADYVGAKHCIVVNNGTISLTLAALAMGLSAGDEVLVPNYTMIATPNSVSMFGAKPIFVDVDPKTLCLDFEMTARAITKRTKAIMLVSANGRYPASGIDAFVALASERGLYLIEDAAQALGSFFPDGKHIGTAGHVGSFSFSAPKIISTGQGGCLVTNDCEIAAKIRLLKDFGRASGGTDIHDTIGFNFKFTDLQACVGIAQMKKLKARVDRKRAIYNLYAEGLSCLDELQFGYQDIENTTPWFFEVKTKYRDQLAHFLAKKGIGSRVMYPPINAQKAYGIPGHFPVSERIGREGLWIPSFTQLTNEQIGYICETIQEFYTAAHYRN